MKYDRALAGGRLLRPASLSQAFTPVALADGRLNSDLYGLGWELEPDSSIGKFVYHAGAAAGLSIAFHRNVTHDQTVIVVDNSHFNARARAMAALRILQGRPVPLPRKSVAQVYGRVLVSRGAKAARDTLETLRADTVDYALDEGKLDRLGYDLMGEQNAFHLPEAHYWNEAVEALRLATEVFPASWNTWDSYGEVLAKVGRKEEAITNYRKSLELNPESETGRAAMARLLKR